MSLTNPGGIGTVHSVPRLMKGQAASSAPAPRTPGRVPERARTLDELAISKTIRAHQRTDLRVIRGAGSGEFLKKVHELLIGQRGFYEQHLRRSAHPYAPIRWNPDIAVDLAERVGKQSRVREALINSFRVRGHLMADIDPLEYVQRSRGLEIEGHGLTFWDLDREFVTGGFEDDASQAPRHPRRAPRLLPHARHRVHAHPGPGAAPLVPGRSRSSTRNPADEQLRVLRKLGEAEAFETFLLQTKFVGQEALLASRAASR